MNVRIAKLDAAEVQRTYPIADRVPGWFFRGEEQSAGVYKVEGTDLWGRHVEHTGIDYDDALNRCLAQAEAINRQLAAKSV